MTRKRIISVVTQIIVKRLVSNVTRRHREVSNAAVMEALGSQALTTRNPLNDGIGTLDPCLLPPLLDTQKSDTLTLPKRDASVPGGRRGCQ